MSSQRGRSKKGQRHARIHHWLAKTEAWATMKPGPRAILVELYLLYNGENNGELFLSEREAGKRLNITKKTARKYLEDLELRGFIRARHKGCFNVKAPVATTWILTEFGYNNQIPTKDFTCWTEKQNTGIKNMPGGYKNYTSSPDNVVKFADTGIKNNPVKANS